MLLTEHPHALVVTDGNRLVASARGPIGGLWLLTGYGLSWVYPKLQEEKIRQHRNMSLLAVRDKAAARRWLTDLIGVPHDR